MADATCGMKSPSVGLEIPGQSFGGIPESLVVYGAITICAVVLYFVVRRLKCAESYTLGDYMPPYLDLLKGCCKTIINYPFLYPYSLCRQGGQVAEEGEGYRRHALRRLPEGHRPLHFLAGHHLHRFPRHQSFP